MSLKELEEDMLSKEALWGTLGRMALNGLKGINKGGVGKTIAHYGDKAGYAVGDAVNAIKTQGLGTATVAGANKLAAGVKNTFNAARNKFAQAKMIDAQGFGTK